MSFPDPNDPALYVPGEALIARNQGNYAVAAKMRLGVSPMLMSLGLDGFSYALADDPGLIDTVLGATPTGASPSSVISTTWASTTSGPSTTWPTRPAPCFRQGLNRVLMPHMERVADAIKATGCPGSSTPTAI
jgi:hypothetical protein